MPQTDLPIATYRSRISKVQDAMREFGLQAIVLEPGPAMQYLTGVRWGRSERTFAVVLPAKGEPAYILPGFEEMRARELIHVGDDIRIWQEDESPYQKVAQVLRDRGVSSGRVGIDETGVRDGTTSTQVRRGRYLSTRPWRPRIPGKVVQ